MRSWVGVILTPHQKGTKAPPIRCFKIKSRHTGGSRFPVRVKLSWFPLGDLGGNGSTRSAKPPIYIPQSPTLARRYYCPQVLTHPYACHINIHTAQSLVSIYPQEETDPHW